MTSFLTSLPPSLLKKKARTPEQLVANTRSSLLDAVSLIAKRKIQHWDCDSEEEIAMKEKTKYDDSVIKSIEERLQVELDSLARGLEEIKNILYGEPTALLPSNPSIQAHLTTDGHNFDLRQVQEEEVIKETARNLQSSGIIIHLINNFPQIPFEPRKNTALIFNCLMKRSDAFISYLSQPEQIVLIDLLIAGYTDPDVALSCGSMIRECTRHDALSLYILSSNMIYRFFDEFALLPNFDVASDAFASLRELLTTPQNSAIASRFLEENHDVVFAKYEVMNVLTYCD
jgi:calcium binding protein 39